jgi:hypothetical protein
VPFFQAANANTAPTGRRARTAEEALGALLAEDGLEDAEEGLREVVLQVVLRVEGEVMLERPDRVLRLLVRLCALRALREGSPL